MALYASPGIPSAPCALLFLVVVCQLRFRFPDMPHIAIHVVVYGVSLFCGVLMCSLVFLFLVVLDHHVLAGRGFHFCICCISQCGFRYVWYLWRPHVRIYLGLLVFSHSAHPCVVCVWFCVVSPFFKEWCLFGFSALWSFSGISISAECCVVLPHPLVFLLHGGVSNCAIFFTAHNFPCCLNFAYSGLFLLLCGSLRRFICYIRRDGIVINVGFCWNATSFPSYMIFDVL